MERYDFRNYQKLLQELNKGEDDFSLMDEKIEEYIALLDEFDPLNAPTDSEYREEYVEHYIIPIMLEYGKKAEAIIEIERLQKGITISLLGYSFSFIVSDSDVKGVFYLADSISIEAKDEDIRIKLYFCTS